MGIWKAACRYFWPKRAGSRPTKAAQEGTHLNVRLAIPLAFGPPWPARQTVSVVRQSPALPTVLVLRSPRRNTSPVLRLAFPCGLFAQLRPEAVPRERLRRGQRKSSPMMHRSGRPVPIHRDETCPSVPKANGGNVSCSASYLRDRQRACNLTSVN
jgi:hypothetical protein